MKARLETVSHRCHYCENTYDGPAEEVPSWEDNDGDFWNVVDEDNPDEDTANENCPWPDVELKIYLRCPKGHLDKIPRIKNNEYQVCGGCGTRYDNNPEGMQLAEGCCL